MFESLLSRISLQWGLILTFTHCCWNAVVVPELFQESFKLRDQNDDLNAQILSLSLYEAKNLFSCHTKAQCLAAEIDNASRDEVRLMDGTLLFVVC